MKIGIALGGGGAKGLAHIGVLKVLQEAEIDCTIVAGTSAGALVGAFYAADVLESLENEVRQVKLTDIPLLLSPTLPVSGLFSGRNVVERLTDLVPVRTIEELPRRYAAVSVDLNRGEIVTTSEGPIHKAIRASISIPGLFTPVIDGDRLLVDGGTMDPVPVRTARDLGAEFVIAVDLFGDRCIRTGTPEDLDETTWPGGIMSAMNYLKSLAGSRRHSDQKPTSTLRERRAASNIIDIVSRTLAITQRELTAARLRDCPPDLIIAPAVGRVGVLDFHRADPIIEIGRSAAKQALPLIKETLCKANSPYPRGRT